MSDDEQDIGRALDEHVAKLTGLEIPNRMPRPPPAFGTVDKSGIASQTTVAQSRHRRSVMPPVAR